MTDNGARALAERIDDMGIFDVLPESRLIGYSPDRLAAAILANGAVFLPDATETEAEHERQSSAGTHLFDEGCRYCCAAELDRLRETNEGLYLAVQMTAKEQDRLRAALTEIASASDDPASRNIARAALQPEGSAGT